MGKLEHRPAHGHPILEEHHIPEPPEEDFAVGDGHEEATAAGVGDEEEVDEEGEYEYEDEYEDDIYYDESPLQGSVSPEVNSANKMGGAWESGAGKRKIFSEAGIHSAGAIGSGSAALVEGRSIKAIVELALVVKGRRISRRIMGHGSCVLGRMHDGKGQPSSN